MTCGKLCSGKTTYAKKLQKEGKAVILSIDEIMLAVFGKDAGEKHDEYVAGIKQYLYQKTLEIIHNGLNVVLDWGFWTKEERAFARSFFSSNRSAYFPIFSLRSSSSIPNTSAMKLRNWIPVMNS